MKAADAELAAVLNPREIKDVIATVVTSDLGDFYERHTLLEKRGCQLVYVPFS